MAIQWLEKRVAGRNRQKLAKGVRLVYTPDEKAGTRVVQTLRVYFGEDILDRLDGNKILFGIDGNKLYFCNDTDGYTLQHYKGYGSPKIVLKNSLAEKLKSFEGSYDTQIDVSNGLPYIDKTRNIQWFEK